MSKKLHYLHGCSHKEAEISEEERDQHDVDRREKARIKRLLKQREVKPIATAYGSSPNIKTHGL